MRSHVPLPPVLTLESDCKWEFRRLLPLQLRSYQPQPLLQRTKEFFQREEVIDGNQTLARCIFVRICTSPEFGRSPTESQLRLLMQSLDTYFFSGLLTGGQDPIVRLESREDIFRQFLTYRDGQMLYWGLTSPDNNGANVWDYRMKIEVEASEPRPWWEGGTVRRDSMDVLQTLVHEMAHAYLMLFSCPCWSCRMELGPTWHGSVWQELKQAMYMEIRRWDPALQGLYINDQERLDPTYVAFTAPCFSW